MKKWMIALLSFLLCGCLFACTQSGTNDPATDTLPSTDGTTATEAPTDPATEGITEAPTAAETEPDEPKKGCKSALAAGTVLALASVIALGAICFKKKD